MTKQKLLERIQDLEERVGRLMELRGQSEQISQYPEDPRRYVIAIITGYDITKGYSYCVLRSAKDNYLICNDTGDFHYHPKSDFKIANS